jgi:DNA-binding transcriptional ArsR family regulator
VSADLDLPLATLIARRFAILGEPTRVRLLNEMNRRGEASVGTLAEAVGSSPANVSKHLGLLRAERMVDRRREGARALYRVADPTLIELCDRVCVGVEGQLRELSSIVEAGQRERAAT